MISTRIRGGGGGNGGWADRGGIRTATRSADIGQAQEGNLGVDGRGDFAGGDLDHAAGRQVGALGVGGREHELVAQELRARR